MLPRYTRRMAPEVLTVVVEIPKGSRNKYEMDHETGRSAWTGCCSPRCSIRPTTGSSRTRSGGDGDPLDALVLRRRADFPGCHIRVRPIGLFRMTDEKGEDEKVLCVPLRDPMWSHVGDLEGIPTPCSNEIEHFFQVYKDLEGHEAPPKGSRTVPPPTR